MSPGQLRSLCVRGDGDREGMATLLCLICRHKEAAQPAVRRFTGRMAMGQRQFEGVLGVGAPYCPFTLLTQIHPTHAACPACAFSAPCLPPS